MDYLGNSDVDWAAAISAVAGAAGEIGTAVSNTQIADAQADTAKYLAKLQGGIPGATTGTKDNTSLYIALGVGGGVLLLTVMIFAMRK